VSRAGLEMNAASGCRDSERRGCASVQERRRLGEEMLRGCWRL
jgi:hypothetical protein